MAMKAAAISSPMKRKSIARLAETSSRAKWPRALIEASKVHVVKSKRKAKPMAPMKSKFHRRRLGTSLVDDLFRMEQQQRGNKQKASRVETEVVEASMSVPLEQRAGFPLVLGEVHPKNWEMKDGTPILVDFGRVAWLPDDFGQGVKRTKPIARSIPGQGGTIKVWVSPQGKAFFHKHMIERFLGRKLTVHDGFNGQLRMAKLQTKITEEKAFFDILEPRERRFIPSARQLHFGIISARRTQTAEGLHDIAVVQAQFEMCGVEPTWYVDEPSLADYQRLGLKAVVGGKLVNARNKALQDAHKLGKACVQVSDDISRWEYQDGHQAENRTDDAANAAWAAATLHIVTPVAAARFLLAKLKAAQGPDPACSPQLAGVYTLHSCARAFGGPVWSDRHFILGDFFVVNKSNVRFDSNMTLKEDYDFTCSHIATHGSVIRCNRLTVQAKHQTNAGGACSNRDEKGIEEQKNIAILLHKWPRAFRMNPKRNNEVILSWPVDGDVKGLKRKAKQEMKVNVTED